jgi:hypothetical protein
MFAQKYRKKMISTKMLTVAKLKRSKQEAGGRK